MLSLRHLQSWVEQIANIVCRVPRKSWQSQNDRCGIMKSCISTVARFPASSSILSISSRIANLYNVLSLSAYEQIVHIRKSVSYQRCMPLCFMGIYSLLPYSSVQVIKKYPHRMKYRNEKATSPSDPGSINTCTSFMNADTVCWHRNRVLVRIQIMQHHSALN